MAIPKYRMVNECTTQDGTCQIEFRYVLIPHSLKHTYIPWRVFIHTICYNVHTTSIIPSLGKNRIRLSHCNSDSKCAFQCAAPGNLENREQFEEGKADVADGQVGEEELLVSRHFALGETQVQKETVGSHARQEECAMSENIEIEESTVSVDSDSDKGGVVLAVDARDDIAVGHRYLLRPRIY